MKCPPPHRRTPTVVAPPDKRRAAGVTSTLAAAQRTPPKQAPPQPRPTIPPFYFPFGKPLPPAEGDLKNAKILAVAKLHFRSRPFLIEPQFVAVTKTCGLPRYMNMIFFRRIAQLRHRDGRVSYDDFINGWETLSQGRFDNASLLFNILKRPGHNTLCPDDFLPVLEDIVQNHYGLRFLADNPIFQERYTETVICRLFYQGRCPSGRMTLAQFRTSGFTDMIYALRQGVDLNTTDDCFSYRHFYVIYCKFWAIDEDHDLIISKSDMENYSPDALSPLAVDSIIKYGRIPAFAHQSPSHTRTPGTLTYMDYIWFLLSEIDKSTPTAIEYWFRCMDTDGDGVLSCFELEHFWQIQEARLRFYGVSEEDQIGFENILRQMNDLIRPKVTGQFRLQDLKQNGYLAERFFDTFLNFDRFQIHESYQGSVRVKRKQDWERREQLLTQEPLSPAAEEEIKLLDESLACDILCDWCEFAETEYQQLLLDDNADDADSVADSELAEQIDPEAYLHELDGGDYDQDEYDQEEYDQDDEYDHDAYGQDEYKNQDESEDEYEIFDDYLNQILQSMQERQTTPSVHANKQTAAVTARATREAETSSSSDNESDTSTPTTPTKTPSPQIPDWTARGVLDKSTRATVNKPGPWLWQPTDKEQSSSDDNAIYWVTDWLQRLDQQRMREASC